MTKLALHGFLEAILADILRSRTGERFGAAASNRKPPPQDKAFYYVIQIRQNNPTKVWQLII